MWRFASGGHHRGRGLSPRRQARVPISAPRRGRCLECPDALDDPSPSLLAGVLGPRADAPPRSLTTGTAHAEPTSPSTHDQHLDHVDHRPSRPRNGYGVRLTTFNILSSAMARGGVDRATRAARWVQDQDATAAAFQEVAKDQLRQMQTVDARLQLLPAAHARHPRLGDPDRLEDLRGQASWRPATSCGRSSAGSARSPTSGSRDRETGRGFWVVAIHNAPGGHESRARRLHREPRSRRSRSCSARTGPVFVDRRRQRAFGVLLQGRRAPPRWSR